jgi:stringent starvation protein B
MSPPPQVLPPKKDVALFLLQGTTMFVHLDPRKPDVVVPDWFRKQPNLILQVGLNMALPIPDLRVDDDCVSGTLSFNRSPFWCKIPWGAVFALVGENGRGMIWPADVPSEVAAQMTQVQPAKGPRLRAVPGPTQVPPPEETPKPKANAKKPSKKKPAEPKTAKPKKPSKAKLPGEAHRTKVKKRTTEQAATKPAEAPPKTADAPPAALAADTPARRALPPYLRVIK